VQVCGLHCNTLVNYASHVGDDIRRAVTSRIFASQSADLTLITSAIIERCVSAFVRLDVALGVPGRTRVGTSTYCVGREHI